MELSNKMILRQAMISCFVLAGLLLIRHPLIGQEARIRVTNPSDAPRLHEPVVVQCWSTPRIAEWLIASNRAGNKSVNLTDQSGRDIVFQLDDLDQDGTPDELVFVADFAAKEAREFTLARSEKRDSFHVRYRTDAQNWKRIDGVLQGVDDDNLLGNKRERAAYRFDGVGWESELVAYRLYLDGRNAVDIQGKRKPGLYWKWIGESGVDYQLDSDWGMDVLHVGPALGVGGIGLWVGDSVMKPLHVDRQRCRILARGPVRSVVRVDYSGWRLPGETVDLTSFFTIVEGERVSEHRVVLAHGSSPKTLVTGIVKHDSTAVIWNAGSLYTVGRQSRANDTLMMALTVPTSSVIGRKEDGYNHLLLLKLEEGRPVSILISSSWQGEPGTMWNSAEIAGFLQSIARRVNEPMKIQIQ